MCMDTNGVQTFIKADKRTLIHQFDLAIPIRDMRLLDSATAIHQRGNIAVREGAIVFSIECAPAVLRLGYLLLGMPLRSAAASLPCTASVQSYSPLPSQDLARTRATWVVGLGGGRWHVMDALAG